MLQMGDQNQFPSGTVTFIFTDIEGSTKLVQEHPKEMPELLARHNAILNKPLKHIMVSSFGSWAIRFLRHLTQPAMHCLPLWKRSEHYNMNPGRRHRSGFGWAFTQAPHR
jgi:hypothetical protein